MEPFFNYIAGLIMHLTGSLSLTLYLYAENNFSKNVQVDDRNWLLFKAISRGYKKRTLGRNGLIELWVIGPRHLY